MAEFKFQNRRDFIKYFIGTSAVIAGFPAYSKELLSARDLTKVTILYTNDIHSRIEPFPKNDPKYANQGGFARRSAVIEEIRKANDHVLLLDAGDIFQGTPYFNLYGGELEYKLMSLMKYDATTIGNHDFDLGIDNITKQMEHASFSFINCNYDFSNTSLHNKIIPYKIFEKQGIKIGVLGYGVELAGLVDKKMYQETIYQNPLPIANATAKLLKHDLMCDYVIALSHLGFKDDKKISDISMAPLTENIDLIIGGHSHTFLEHPVKLTNRAGKPIHITQVGWAGICLGKLDVYFSHGKKKISHNSDNRKI
ncbi:MAG: metallophosphoesterase [Bacteroidota bacterium]|jgi:5'-nucleotidase|nr:metallophosphoesterase [Bacteroidota bacterium]